MAFAKNSAVKRLIPLAALLLWCAGCAHVQNATSANTRADFLKIIDRPRVALDDVDAKRIGLIGIGV
jgi:hypothetical protein